MFDKNIFAKRLFDLRSSRRISQEQLGEAINLSRYAIGKMESGQRAASIEVLYSLADFFDVSTDYLLGRSDNPERR